MARIAYVVWTFPVLSQTFVVEELLAVQDLGWEPIIVACREGTREADNPRAKALLTRTRWLERAGRKKSVRAVAGTVLRHPVRALACAMVAVGARSRWSIRNLWWGFALGALVRREDVSLLHVHFADDAGDIAYFAARMTGVPYVLTVHAVDIYMGRFLCRKLHEAAQVVTVCRYNVGEMESRCPNGLDRPAVIKYAGVDTSRFRLVHPRPFRPAREVIAVGRLVEKKGFAHLIEAVAILVAEGRDVHCRIVGDGPLRDELRAQIDAGGLGGIVDILGATSPDQLIDLYYQSDVLAAPCTIASWRDRDSMPVVLKEAMAMELPVVASDDFGIPELVEPGTGVLVPRDDPAALARALADLFDRSPEERAAIGRAGRRVVEKRFQERLGAELLTGCWDRLLQAR